MNGGGEDKMGGMIKKGGMNGRRDNWKGGVKLERVESGEG